MTEFIVARDKVDAVQKLAAERKPRAISVECEVCGYCSQEYDVRDLLACGLSSEQVVEDISGRLREEGWQILDGVVLCSEHVLPGITDSFGHG